MKFKFLIVLAIAGMATVGCSSSKSGNGTMDTSAVDTSKKDTMMRDTTKTPPDTTKKQGNP